MSGEPTYRLADSTLIEPLVDKWVAWPYLISPATASLHLLRYQVKTMQEYLQNPALHAQACRNPELIGGPFINIPSERANEVRELLAQTEEKQGLNLEFARAIVEFQNQLVANARGQSLDPFYDQLPAALRGHVELLYDYYNRPLVRFIEGLLYQSDYYHPELQSLRISQLVRDDERTFFLSTPRLPQPGQIDWKVPFAHPLVEELFKLDTTPQPLGHIREILGLTSGDDQFLPSFLTSDPANAPVKWSGPGVRLRYFGHACVLVEWSGVSVLTDPFIGIRPLAGGLARLSFGDLPPKIDYVLITHNHSDHFVLETLLRLRHRIGALVVPKTYGILYGDISLKLMAQKLGFKHVLELDTMESIALPHGEIVAIPFFGEHGDLAHGKTGYVVRAGAERIMFGADSDCLDRRVYENVRRSLGPIETVFLGTECVGAPLTWSYGPLFPVQPERHHVQSRRQHGCDSEAALEILETLGARRFYNYGMGLEPWLEQILALGLSVDSLQIKESNRLLANARGRGLLSAERLFGSRDIYLEERAGLEAGRIAARDPHSDKVEQCRVQRIRKSDSKESSPSGAQQQIWQAGKTAPNNCPSHVAAAIKITGPLHLETLEQSLNALWLHQPILRSRFSEVNGELTAVIRKNTTLRLPLMDLAELPVREREAETSRLARAEYERPFLDDDALFRTILLRETAQTHILLFTLPRLICDGSSLRLLIRQMASSYEAFQAGTCPSFARSHILYTDFVQWQRRRLDGEGGLKQLAYWEGQLDGLVPELQLPADHPRPPTPHLQRRSRQSLALSLELSDKLKEISRQQNCSLFTILLAAFHAFLQRQTDQDHLSIGTLISNRHLPETEELVGPLANILVLRTDVSGNPVFLTLLERVSRVMATAYAHRDVPFEQLALAWLRERAAQDTPLFQVSFVLDCALMPPLARGGLRWDLLEIERGLPKHDLSLFVHTEGETINGTLEYDADLFDAPTVATMLKQFENVLEGIAKHPDCRLADLPFYEKMDDSYLGDCMNTPGPNDAADQFVF
jgi:L-ascorbate metabolism protein UlaG (beta-lactamase superfamily)